jgi:hypothetical protein
VKFESVQFCCLWIDFGVKLFSDIFVTLQQDSIKGAKWSGAAEMTEEQALAEQQRMFAEARARMNGGTVTSNQPDADQSLEN